MMGQYLK